MDDEIRIDLSQFTLGEIETFEELTGMAISNFGEGKPFPAKALVALVYLVKRRADPAFTLDDARGILITGLPDFGSAPPPPEDESQDPTPLRAVGGAP